MSERETRVRSREKETQKTEKRGQEGGKKRDRQEV